MRSLSLLSALSSVSHALVVMPAARVISSDARFFRGTSQTAASGLQASSLGLSDAVDLTQAFARKSPAETLKELSEAAERYNIQQQDVYGEGAPWMAEFESEVASLLGKEAAVFCPSGVMAQLIALKIYGSSTGETHSQTEQAEGQPPRNDRVVNRELFLVHHSSHLLLHEENAHKELIGFDAVRVGVPQRPVSFSDLRAALDALVEDEKGDSSPSCFILEVPHRELGGAFSTPKDVQEMSQLLKARGVAFHCDGARLWEAQPFFGQSFEAICNSFDSVYVSFYKGLGGMTGAMLVGSDAFVAEARVWLRRFGGNVYTSLPYAVSGLHGFRTQLGSFEDRWHKLKRVAALLDDLALGSATTPLSAVGTTSSTSAEDFKSAGAADVSAEDRWHEPIQFPLVRFEPAVPQCCMAHCYIVGSQTDLERARDDVLAEKGIKVFNRLRGTNGEGFNGRPGECYFEWNIGPLNVGIPDELIVDAWTSFLNTIRAGYAAGRSHR